MMRAALVAALLLVVPLADGSMTLKQSVLQQPSAAIPVTLLSGLAGSTTLGTSATSATTTGVSLPAVGTATALRINPGAADWKVRVRLVSLSGAGVLDTMTLAISQGSPTSQVLVVLGAVTQSQGSTVTLSHSGSPMTVLASGACVGTCSFTLRIEFFSTTSSDPIYQYAYSLGVT